jgi:hypothetical protein
MRHTSQRAQIAVGWVGSLVATIGDFMNNVNRPLLIFIFLIILFIGLFLVSYFSSWKIAVGVFFMIWADNIASILKGD